MIRYVLQSIAEILRKHYPDSEIYFNPVREVSGNSFVLNLLTQTQTGEIGDAELFQFDMDIFYIPQMMQVFENGAVDSRLLDGVTVASNLFSQLRILIISGFYNIETGNNDECIEVVPFERRTAVLGDVAHFYCSIEFRGHYQIANPEETIKEYLLRLKVISIE